MENGKMKHGNMIAKLMLAGLLATASVLYDSCDMMNLPSQTAEAAKAPANLGTKDYVIKDRSGLPYAESRRIAGKILDIYLSWEERRPYMADLVRKNGIETIIADTGENTGGYYKTGTMEIVIADSIFMESIMVHELVHFMQYRDGAMDAIAGMRPDVIVALELFMEFCADFYSAKNPVRVGEGLDDPEARQSDYMEYVLRNDWLSPMRAEIVLMYVRTYMERRTAVPERVSDSSDAAALEVVRMIANCREPEVVGTSDGTLAFAYAGLRALCHSPDIARAERERFLELCSLWDAKAERAGRSVLFAAADERAAR